MAFCFALGQKKKKREGNAICGKNKSKWCSKQRAQCLELICLKYLIKIFNTDLCNLVFIITGC